MIFSRVAPVAAPFVRVLGEGEALRVGMLIRLPGRRVKASRLSLFVAVGIEQME